jgi:hypothetical protein
MHQPINPFLLLYQHFIKEIWNLLTCHSTCLIVRISCSNIPTHYLFSHSLFLSLMISIYNYIFFTKTTQSCYFCKVVQYVFCEARTEFSDVVWMVIAESPTLKDIYWFYVRREQRTTNVRVTSYTIWFEKRRIKSAVHEYGRPASFGPIHTELFLGGLRSVMLVTCRASVCAVSQDAVTIRRTSILSVAKLASFRAALKHKIYFNILIYKRRRGF